jgi:TRAP-type uncharacterized transport system fused permease subunit
VEILAAHLFVFYFAVLADVTPPVAVTAFAGAQMAGADPMRTGWQAFRVAISGFLAPFLFVYQPALLWRGPATDIAILFASAVIGSTALSAAAAGHMFRPQGLVQRLLLVAVALAAIGPHLATSVATSVALVLYAIWDWRGARRPPAPAVVVAGGG